MKKFEEFNKVNVSVSINENHINNDNMNENPSGEIYDVISREAYERTMYHGDKHERTGTREEAKFFMEGAEWALKYFDLDQIQKYKKTL